MTVKRQCIPRNGKTIREIAEKTGYSIGTVHRYVKEMKQVRA
jgi:iclR helix-turn-helix domain